MMNIIMEEFYKLPKKNILIYMGIAVIISSILSVGLLFYNINTISLTPTSKVILVYSLSSFTPFLFVFYGIITTYLISIEYDNNMWAILFVSKNKRMSIIDAKLIVSIILHLSLITIFFISSSLLSYLFIKSTISFALFIYTLIAYCIGTLAMITILFFLSLIIENKIYIILISIVTGLGNLLLQHRLAPFKFPEYIINSRELLNNQSLNRISHEFIYYSFYSLLVFCVVYIMMHIYVKRKDF
ncbi:ABC transporter permease [Macrococcoides caseolyticum]|uniref:ABC transporter permease n=1 Tax=Macrococcoides caseolyticum TaxID=69966 RepID=UPI001F1E9F56|nr:ABC transporter permease [Macrococcus caseolyticus]MCE4958057.1 ABC transporter permease [Macrococcus caseolyticus]